MIPPACCCTPTACLAQRPRDRDSLTQCDDAILRQPRALAAAVAPCALLFLVPSHLNMLLHALRGVDGPWRLRHVVCCGESLPPSIVKGFCDAAHIVDGAPTRLHNVYGPTEAAMTHHVCVPNAPEVLIGKPIDNATVCGSPARTHKRRRGHVCGVRCARCIAVHASSAECKPAFGRRRFGSSTHRAGSCPSAHLGRYALAGSSRLATWPSRS
jgi:hypothetical protein